MEPPELGSTTVVAGVTFVAANIHFSILLRYAIFWLFSYLIRNCLLGLYGCVELAEYFGMKALEVVASQLLTVMSGLPMFSMSR